MEFRQEINELENSVFNEDFKMEENLNKNDCNTARKSIIRFKRIL